MKKIAVKSLAYLAIFIFSTTVALLAYMYFIFNPCDFTVLRSIPSPDNRTFIIVFETDCGATTPFNTQISLVPIGKAFSPWKNPSFFALRDRHRLDVQWVTSSNIEIKIPDDANISKKEYNIEGVTVTYR